MKKDSTDWYIPALTIAISIPFPMAWYKNALCIDSRILVKPRKEKERLDRPPLILHPGHSFLITGHKVICGKKGKREGKGKGKGKGKGR